MKEAVEYENRIFYDKNGLVSIIYSKDKKGVPVSYVIDILTDEFNITKSHLLNILFSKGEYENNNVIITRIISLIKDKNLKSQWIQCMYSSLYYIVKNEDNIKEVMIYLEYLDTFRSKISEKYEIITDEYLFSLNDNEILMISKCLHSLNILLEDYGGIIFSFGKILLEDVKNYQIESFFKKEIDYSNYPFSKKHYEYPWSISYRLIYEITYSCSINHKIKQIDIQIPPMFHQFQIMKEIFSSIEKFNIKLKPSLHRRLLLSIYNIFIDDKGFNQIHLNISFGLLKDISIIEFKKPYQNWIKVLKGNSIKFIEKENIKKFSNELIPSIPQSKSKFGTFHPPEALKVNQTYLKLNGLEKNISIQEFRQNDLNYSINSFLDASLTFKFKDEMTKFIKNFRINSLRKHLYEFQRSKNNFEKLNILNYIVNNYILDEVYPFLIDDFDEWKFIFSLKHVLIGLNKKEQNNCQIIRRLLFDLNENGEFSIKKFLSILKIYVKFIRNSKNVRSNILFIFSNRFIQIFEKYQSKSKLKKLITVLKKTNDENPLETLFEFSRNLIIHILELLGIFESISPKESYENWTEFSKLFI